MDRGRTRESPRPGQSGHRPQTQTALHAQRWTAQRPGQGAGLCGSRGGRTRHLHVRQPTRVHCQRGGVAGGEGGVVQHPRRYLRPDRTVQERALPVLRALRPAAGLQAEPDQEGAGRVQR